jgi:carboxyl-terminal processing protease
MFSDVFLFAVSVIHDFSGVVRLNLTGHGSKNMNYLPLSLRAFASFSLGGLITTSTLFLNLLPSYGAPTSNFKENVEALVDKVDSKALVDEVWQIVNNFYVDRTFNNSDWEATRRQLLSVDYRSKTQAYAAIRSALKKLNDPYTRFLDPQKFAELTQQTSGELSGIGARIVLDKITKMLTVVETFPDSPASKAGLKTGDRILEVNGVSVRGMDADRTVSLVRGKPGTLVTLKIAREGTKAIDIALTRQVVRVSVVTSVVKQEGDRRIGYFRLLEFDNSADTQVKAAIESLKKQNVQGFVLDLRGNPGGLLSMAVGVSSLWLGSGSIVKAVVRNGDTLLVETDGTAMTHLPLALLVDGGSASASEIVTGALQDRRRAIIVGTKTFGKGIVQHVYPLPGGSGLSITVAKYFTPNGTDINHKGILPNVVVPLTQAQIKKLSENPNLLASQSDLQYKRAVQSLFEATSNKPSISSRGISDPMHCYSLISAINGLANNAACTRSR